MTLKQSSYLEEEMNQLIYVLIESTLEVVVVVEIRKKSFFFKITQICICSKSLDFGWCSLSRKIDVFCDGWILSKESKRVDEKNLINKSQLRLFSCSEICGLFFFWMESNIVVVVVVDKAHLTNGWYEFLEMWILKKNTKWVFYLLFLL